MRCCFGRLAIAIRKAGWSLTIHSRGTRFAGPLNSGVMPPKHVGLCSFSQRPASRFAHSLASCACRFKIFGERRCIVAGMRPDLHAGIGLTVGFSPQRVILAALSGCAQAAWLSDGTSSFGQVCRDARRARLPGFLILCGITIHSRGSHFVAPLNSGVRRQQLDR